MKCVWHGVENCPVARVEEAVREFTHDHDEGVCKPECYGCFIILEAKKDVEAAVKAEHSGSLQHHHAWMCEMELRKAAELQVGEVAAHRDRLRDMLNDVRGMAFSVAFSSKEDLAARILRRIEDGIVEKPRREKVAYCSSCGAFNEAVHKEGCAFLENQKGGT